MSAGAARPTAVEAFERALVLSEAIAAAVRLRESLEQAAPRLAAADAVGASEHVEYLVEALATARSAAAGLADELAGLLSEARSDLRAAHAAALAGTAAAAGHRGA